MSSSRAAADGLVLSGAEGSKYTLQAFISPGASGPSPVFLGAGTAVVANYASGR